MGTFQQQLTFGTEPGYDDWDIGVTLNYDNDPEDTPDFIFIDGNGTQTYALFANRLTTQYVSCGDVYSDPVNLGANEDAEMIVTAARLSPTVTIPVDTSVTFYMSNEEPPNWQQANPCVDNLSDYCVSFAKPVGRTVRWKAVLCSNEPTRTSTPTISNVAVTYDFAVAAEHYRSGVIVNDGVAYAGGFRQPGYRGRFHATNAGLDTKYWEAGAKLDAMSDVTRNIYTSTVSGNSRLDFTLAEASNTQLIHALLAADQPQAEAIITWQRSERFGAVSDGLPFSRLGAVETSTPAVVSKPGLPSWYTLATQADRQKVDAFIGTYSSRQLLVMFGSKDGAIHAVYNNPTDIANPDNGKEAWAFIPRKIAQQFASDMNQAIPSAYPDGSPSVADVKLSDGEMHTVAVFGSGNGGRTITALDITSSDTNGPIPLWHYTPGGSTAGMTHSKPTIARVSISGSEKFIAIFGSGVAPENSSPPFTKGRMVVAVDMSTGARQWRFRAMCPITSDITAFETANPTEPGTPTIDGYIDRIVFSDYCGNVYKLDPNVYIGGSGATDGYIDTVGMGTIPVGTDPASKTIYALFTTAVTTGALGEERPIAGTIGARTDSSNSMVLFFGTGGIESYDPTKPNQFYAVYAHNGVIRSKIDPAPACVSNRCEKFYGGVVVTSEQVVFTRTIDPEIGTGACDFGSSHIDGMKLNDSDGIFDLDFSQSLPSGGIVSSLYGDAGAVYATNLAGEMIRIGTPRSANAGGDTDGGHGGGYAVGNETVVAKPLSLLGWRQIY